MNPSSGVFLSQSVSSSFFCFETRQPRETDVKTVSNHRVSHITANMANGALRTYIILALAQNITQTAQAKLHRNETTKYSNNEGT